jgi:hypothetical protein
VEAFHEQRKRENNKNRARRAKGDLFNKIPKKSTQGAQMPPAGTGVPWFIL